ncbi:MAG: DegV family protein [Clostridia bacterium]|nr:DegV family protein [Clostridia bacterium]
MKNLIISLEATCDLTKEIIKQYNLDVVDMEFMVGEDTFSTKEDDVVSSNLYERMKQGDKTSTSQINQALYEEHFENLLKTGGPILHLAFSSGLSCTYNSAKKASEVLNEKYGKKIYVIDTLAACSGHGLLAILTRSFSESAKDIGEVVEFVEKTKHKIKHIFTVDNLKYLANGGRLKTSSAIIGTILNIKPVMQTDEEGKLVVESKVISRKKALLSLFEKMKKNYDREEKMCFISHSACLGDAEFLCEKIKTELGLEPIIANLGPIIGSHSGPGTLAMFYLEE